MSEYLIVPLAKQRDQLAISKSLHAHGGALTARRGRYWVAGTKLRLSHVGCPWSRAATARRTFSPVSGRTRKLHRADQREGIIGHDFRAAAKSIAPEVAGVCVRHTVPAARVAGPVGRSGRLAHHLGEPLRRDRATAGRPRCCSARWTQIGSPSSSRVIASFARPVSSELSLGPYLQTRHDRLGNFRALAVAEGCRLPVGRAVRLPA